MQKEVCGVFVVFVCLVSLSDIETKIGHITDTTLTFTCYAERESMNRSATTVLTVTIRALTAHLRLHSHTCVPPFFF